MVRIAHYGKTVLFDDVGMFYIRRHAGQDTWTSTNTPSIQQIINLEKCFYDVFKKYNDKLALQNFPIKSVYFLKGKYENFLSLEDRRKYSFKDVILQANQCGLPVSVEDDCPINSKKFRSYRRVLKKNLKF